MPDINLIPPEEKKVQKRVKVVKSSTIFSIILFLIVAGVSGYFYYQTSQIKEAIKGHNGNIRSLRADIEILTEIEIVARNLGQRLETLKGILQTRSHYSVLLSELKKRVPETVELDTFGTGRGGTINVSGQGVDYISIAKFIRDLSDEDFPEASDGLGGLFTNVSLNSVNLDVQTDKARFFIVVTLDETLLRK